MIINTQMVKAAIAFKQRGDLVGFHRMMARFWMRVSSRAAAKGAKHWDFLKGQQGEFIVGL